VIIGVPAVPLWLPNPLLWLGIFLLARGCIKSVLFVGTVAALLAMLPVLNPAIGFEDVVRSPGYAAWLGSMLLLVFAGYLAPLFPRQPGPVEEALWEVERELSVLRYEIREMMETAEPRNDSTWRASSSYVSGNPCVPQGRPGAARRTAFGALRSLAILLPTADSSGQRGQIEEEGKRRLEAV